MKDVDYDKTINILQRLLKVQARYTKVVMLLIYVLIEQFKNDLSFFSHENWVAIFHFGTWTEAELESS